MTTALLALTLACSCPEFAADVARRADLMAADVKTMPHVVEEGLHQLVHDAREQHGMRRLSAKKVRRMEAMEKLRAELAEVIARSRAAFEAEIDWPAVEAALEQAAKETR